MACVCDRCVRNANTLGVADKALSQAVLRKAFRAAARKWHPDRFENDRTQQHNAEEIFKQMHTAYRELWEHLDAPVILEPEAEPVQPSPQEKPRYQTPHIFFGGLPGCYSAPNFPHFVSGLLLGLLHEQEQALGFVELSRRSLAERPAFRVHALYQLPHGGAKCIANRFHALVHGPWGCQTGRDLQNRKDELVAAMGWGD